MQNPYNNQKMLPHDSEMFFGREGEIRRMEQMLSSDNPQNISIAGLRRIGKSSLANRVYHHLKESKENIAVFLDCGGLEDACESKNDFFRELNEKFLAYKDRFDAGSDTLFEDYSSFKRFVEREYLKGYRFLIFIDEFASLPEMDFADDSFFSNLRSLGNNPENRLAFVTVSQKSLKEMTHKEIETSEFWNIFSPETLGLLDEKAVVDLRLAGFQKNDLTLEEADILDMDYYAGAFPFFNQMVCSHIFEEKIVQGRKDRNRLEVALLDYYEKIWLSRSKEEQKILKTLAKGNMEENQLIKGMQVRGILKCINGMYYPFSKFFSELIENHFKIEGKLTVDGAIDGVIKYLGKANQIKSDVQKILPEKGEEAKK